jgi:hypothetical protein
MQYTGAATSGRACARDHFRHPHKCEVDGASILLTKWVVTTDGGRKFPKYTAHFIFSTSILTATTESMLLYEQWNCEFNLYRVTIELLPHFFLLICAVSRD